MYFKFLTRCKEKLHNWAWLSHMVWTTLLLVEKSNKRVVEGIS